MDPSIYEAFLWQIPVCVVSVILTFHYYLDCAPVHALHIGLTCGVYPDCINWTPDTLRSLFGSVVWRWQNKSPSSSNFCWGELISSVQFWLVMEKEKLWCYSLLIQFGGLRCKSMTCGKRIQSQLWPLAVFFLLLFPVLFFCPMGGSTHFFFLFFLFCVQHLPCTVIKTPLCSLMKTQRWTLKCWASVACRG